MQNLYSLAINQLNSMKGEFIGQTFELIRKVLNSPNKWAMFEKHKHEFNMKWREMPMEN